MGHDKKKFGEGEEIVPKGKSALIGAICVKPKVLNVWILKI